MGESEMNAKGEAELINLVEDIFEVYRELAYGTTKSTYPASLRPSAEPATDARELAINLGFEGKPFYDHAVSEIERFAQAREDNVTRIAQMELQSYNNWKDQAEKAEAEIARLKAECDMYKRLKSQIEITNTERASKERLQAELAGPLKSASDYAVETAIRSRLETILDNQSLAALKAGGDDIKIIRAIREHLYAIMKRQQECASREEQK